MLSVKNLSYRYHSTDPYVFEDVNLSIDKGQIVRLDGPNGIGKSTLIFALTGFISHYLGGDLQGEVRYDNMNLWESDLIDRIKTLNVLFQDPEIQISFSLLSDEISYQLKQCMLLTPDKWNEILELLQKFELHLDLNCKIQELSWGQKKLVSFISLLLNRPMIYCLDEPFSGISLNHARLIEEIIKKESDEGNIFIIADHTSYPLNYHQSIKLNTHVVR